MKSTRMRHITKVTQRATSQRRTFLLTKELTAKPEKSETEEENGRFESERSERRIFD
jgi:hypothetical protein